MNKGRAIGLLVLVLSVLPVATAWGAERIGGDIRIFLPEAGYLGIEIRDVREVEVGALGLPQEAGVYLESVQPQTPAARAQLKKGDVLVGYAGVSVLSVRQFQRLVSETPPGREVVLGVVRDGQQIRTTIRVGNRRASRIRTRLPDSWQDTMESLELLMEPERLSHFFSGRMRLGIVGGNLTEQMGDFLGVPGKRGILIMEVRPNSAAEHSGLKAGDVIKSIDGQAVIDLHDLSRRLTNSTHELEIVREKQVRQVRVEFDSQARDRKHSLRM